ncbi:MAG TPA: haloacid dehalogenase type II [Streptosporangiaceae bacterium]|jgi:2-haloacid dehalogenase|nr:haloacid dehalogenase type II [Streptosporangiaceae bacterium]
MRVLLFDVFGTLVDWRSSMIELAATARGRAGPRADWAGIIDDWRRAYQPALDRVRQGAAWRDLDSLQRETLSRVLAERGVSLSATARESLVRGWRQLRAWPDSREGLDRLRRTHVTATLSNGHVALLADLLKFADLRVDAVLSAQLSASYKPDPRVYLTALDLLDCRPQEAGMVAAHPSDLRAAAAVGLRPIFVRRPFEWGPGASPADPPALDGLLEADGLSHLADALGC